MTVYTYTSPTLDASGISLPVRWEILTSNEQRAMRRHQAEILQVSRYARIMGKKEIRIAGDDSEGEYHGGFKAVTFLHNGITVTARTIFDVQYYFS